jgi:hypothetical protein
MRSLSLELSVIVGHFLLVSVYLLAAFMVWADGSKLGEHFGPNGMSRELLSSLYFAMGFWGLTAFPFFFWERTWKLFIVSVSVLYELTVTYSLTALIGVGAEMSGAVVATHGVTLGVGVLLLGAIYTTGQVSFLWND